MLHIDTMSSSEFKDACDRAAAYSAKHECTAHLNARVRMFTYGLEPRFEVTFFTSDWYDSESTVATWNNGKRRD